MEINLSMVEREKRKITLLQDAPSPGVVLVGTSVFASYSVLAYKSR